MSKCSYLILKEIANIMAIEERAKYNQFSRKGGRDI